MRAASSSPFTRILYCDETLGNVLLGQGKRLRDAHLLEQAADAYRTALVERTSDRVPIDWAATQNNLGKALFLLGQLPSDLGRVEEAVTVYRTALRSLDPQHSRRLYELVQEKLREAQRTVVGLHN